MANDDFVQGDYNALCDTCGFKFKRSMLRKTWDGLLVCSDDWEPKHPQESIRVKPEKQRVKDARPEPELTFIGTNEVTPDDL